MTGHITDGVGFIRNLKEHGVEVKGQKMVIIGTVFIEELAVADVVYNPLETLLVKKAKEAGCRAAIGGIGMLLWQGAAAFELFTGKEMPVNEVKEKFFSKA